MEERTWLRRVTIRLKGTNFPEPFLAGLRGFYLLGVTLGHPFTGPTSGDLNLDGRHACGGHVLSGPDSTGMTGQPRVLQRHAGSDTGAPEYAAYLSLRQMAHFHGLAAFFASRPRGAFGVVFRLIQGQGQVIGDWMEHIAAHWRGGLPSGQRLHRLGSQILLGTLAGLVGL